MPTNPKIQGRRNARITSTKSFEELYEKLNPQQREAVTHVDGPMIVLAGPGTGKTQIIAMRIAYLLRNTQMDPQNILCLTFTESGVVAMRKRLIEIIGSTAYYVRIHTFHSFCNDVIKDFPEKFLFARELEALTDVERVQILRAILDELPPDSSLKTFGDPYLYRRDISSLIQNLKRENISPDDLEQILAKIASFLAERGPAIEDFISIHGGSLKPEDLESAKNLCKESPLSFAFDNTDISALEKKERTKLKNEIKTAYLELKNQLSKQQEFVSAYRAYQAKLKKRGRYDFEDMILFVVQKFQEDEELLARYREQFQYILVDEYQDTNGAQNRVVQLIGEFFENPNIFVVGDDKQSVYRFQGASLANILYFYKLYRDSVKLVSLKENYRSQQSILDAAHSLIQYNEQGVQKYLPAIEQELHAALSIPSAKIHLAEFDSPRTEHYFLAKRVRELILGGSKPSEIAIFYRNNRDARDLMDIFIRLEVPFRLEAKRNVLHDRDINKLLRLLKVIRDITNEHDLFYALHFDFLGFSPLDITKLMAYRTKSRKSLIELMTDEATLIASGLNSSQDFITFANNCLAWKSLSVNSPLVEFFDHVIKESGYLDFVMASEDKIEKLNRLNTFFDEIKALNQAQHDLTLEEFLSHLELLEENEISIKEHELRTKRDAVNLMTAHKSKGLEFDHVFIMKCVDKHWGNNPERGKIKAPQGLLQNELVKNHKEKNEDERRLFYVAMTRARKSVTISFANKNENDRPQVPSIFLAELDPNHTEKLNTEQIEEEALERLQSIFLAVPKQDRDAEEEDFVRGMLGNYTMSITHLNNYLRCPRLFYYGNLLRVPRAKTKHAAFGTAVHDSLKDFTVEYKKSDHLPSKDFLLEKFEKHMKRQIMTQRDLHDSLAFGRQMLAPYYDENKDKFAKHAFPEYNFSSHGVNLDGIPLTGKLDNIEILNEADHTVHVVDYKTGNPDSKSKDLKPGGEYHRQIAFYQLLCDLSPKFPYRMVSGEINFIQQSKRDGKFKSARFTISQQELTDLKTIIKDVYEDIQNLKFLHPDEWSYCGECEYCRLFTKS